MRYRIERRLVRDSTAKARLEGTKITESNLLMIQHCMQ